MKKFHVLLPAFTLLIFSAYASLPALAKEEEPLKPCVINDKAPSAVEISPFEKTSQANILTPSAKRSKNLWADSYLFIEIPRLDDEGKIITEKEDAESVNAVKRIQDFIKVEEWYHQAPPSLEGKYVLIEFWATWCPPCRRSLPLLENWHKKFGKELVVISICETDRKAVDECPGDLKGKDFTHYIGIDTKRRCANALNVYGIPHAVLLEPQFGAVVWEGMPNQPNYELTDEIIERILSVGRKQKAQKSEN
ncbi:MAG: TlpA disulfide reductase family protein [Planctomycetia bacterium]|nr:TlpA disulfide reductase family protein [Planctomycetia bacterium]